MKPLHIGSLEIPAQTLANNAVRERALHLAEAIRLQNEAIIHGVPVLEEEENPAAELLKPEVAVIERDIIRLAHGLPRNDGRWDLRPYVDQTIQPKPRVKYQDVHEGVPRLPPSIARIPADMQVKLTYIPDDEPAPPQHPWIQWLAFWFPIVAVLLWAYLTGRI